MLTFRRNGGRAGALAGLAVLLVAVTQAAAMAAPPPPTCIAGFGFCINVPPVVPPPAPAPGDVAAGIAAGMLLPVPKIHTTPNSPTYVRVSTSFWVEPGVWQNFTRTETVANETVTVTATRDHLSWDFGDQGTLVCHGPGGANDRTCAHTYQRSSTTQPGGSYPINATMTWALSWTCAGADCQGQFGPTPLDPPATSPGQAALVVGEIQSNTSPGA